jgi:hypothetical protein
MFSGAAVRTDNHSKTGIRENEGEALHQLLLAWGKRLISPAQTVQTEKKSYDEHVLTVTGGSARIGTVTLASISLSNWQQQAMTQLTHSLMLTLTKHGRDVDAAYVMHLQQIQRAGEISPEQCLERLGRLCPDEMASLPAEIRAKISCIKQGIH